MSEIENEMYVQKRDGNNEPVNFNKIKSRIDKMCDKFDIHDINRVNLCIKVIDQLHNNISTSQIDELTAQQCAIESAKHPSYGVLAKGIIISNYQKNTSSSFVELVNYLSKESNILNEDFVNLVNFYAEEFEAMIDHERDFLLDYFGFKTLERAYLLKDTQSQPIERIQHMFLRVAIQIHKNNLDLVKETYDLMSTKQFIHATPTMFNSGLQYNQLSSCFLLALEDDSLEGIFNTLKDCANISKWAGGIGMHISNLRAKNSIIHSTHGKSNGIVPMLRVFNDTSKFINQGGKRNGSFAIYLEPWHADVLEFLEMKKNHGDEESKARDLFYALWIPDLFMKRVVANGDWSLFCPMEAPGLSDVYGDVFDALYLDYEKEGARLARKTMKARDLWKRILDAQMETGTPYLLYKDACNRKSNQKNLGIIKSSNLCSEIVEYSDEHETAVCNLASIALPSCVNQELRVFDHAKLHALTKVVTRNLNEIIDVNFYPTPKTKRSNYLHRPIGIGVQGLADTFCLLNLSFESNEAKELNRQIFETIYHAALERSVEISKERTGVVYAHYEWEVSELMLIKEKKKQLTQLLLLETCSEVEEKEIESLHSFFKSSFSVSMYEKYMSELEFLFLLDCHGSEAKKEMKLKLQMIFQEYSFISYLLYCTFRLIKDIMNVNHSDFIDKIQTEIILQELQEERDIESKEEETKEEQHTPTRKSPHLTKEKEEKKYQSSFFFLFCEQTTIFYNEKTYYFIFLEAWNVFQRMRLAVEMNQIELIPKIWNQIGAYSTFGYSPTSEGKLQFDLWSTEDEKENETIKLSPHYDWNLMKEEIKNYGLRNSLLVAPMPTASTSQILGFNECFEPFTSNIYTRRTLAGEFIVVNRYLMRELIEMNLWNEKIRQSIIANKGSISHLSFLPEEFRNKYKIVWEMSMKNLIDMAADRGAFICQSQSLNLWQENPNQNTLTSMHFYAFKKGLKTGIYYLRRKAKHQAQQFTIDPSLAEQIASNGFVFDKREDEEQKKEKNTSLTTNSEIQQTNKEQEQEHEEPCLSCSA